MTKISINFYLRQPKQKGRKAIYATVRYQRQTAILFPGLSIHSNDWVTKKGISKPRDIPENNSLKDCLYEFGKLVRETHEELQKLYPQTIVSAHLLKKTVNSKKLMREVNDIIKTDNEKIRITEFFQKMVDDSKNKTRLNKNGKVLTNSTISTYETTIKHFVNFEAKQNRNYLLSEINQKLIDDFANYLTHDLKMAFNGAGKYMKTFRTMMSYAQELRFITENALVKQKVIVTHESPDNIYLTRKDIKDMLALECFDSKLYEVVRDLFVVGCLTGLRFSDFSELRKARIENDLIHMTFQKTQSKGTIPVHPIVKEIISKYPKGLPNCPPNQVFNRYLKEIGKRLPQLNTDFEKILTRGGVPDPKTYKRYELLSSHTARRSFATNEYLNKTPVMTIMAITGHKSEKTFRAYIKLDSLEHAMLLAAKWKAGDENL